MKSVNSEKTAETAPVGEPLRYRVEYGWADDKDPEGTAGLVILGWEKSGGRVLPAELLLPAFLEGQPVVKVGAGALAGMTGVRRLVIPEGIQALGDRAFYKCRSLRQMVLPASIYVLGAEVFDGCPGLVVEISGDSLNETAEIPDAGQNDGSLEARLRAQGVVTAKMLQQAREQERRASEAEAVAGGEPAEPTGKAAAGLDAEAGSSRRPQLSRPKAPEHPVPLRRQKNRAPSSRHGAGAVSEGRPEPALARQLARRCRSWLSRHPYWRARLDTALNWLKIISIWGLALSLTSLAFYVLAKLCDWLPRV